MLCGKNFIVLLISIVKSKISNPKITFPNEYGITMIKV